MRILLIGCGLLLRELSDAIVHSPHLIDARYLPAGLHDSGIKPMRNRLQEEIDSVDSAQYDAVVLGYGLCGTGTAGLKARSLPVIIPRAHDCITLLMGSRSKYSAYFDSHPGVYFRSVGWIERAGQFSGQLSNTGLSENLDVLIAHYGEEAGTFLYEEATRYKRSYNKLTYIRTGSELDDTFVEKARTEAVEKKWEFEEFGGELTLFRRLLAGNWDVDFLVTPPGHEIVASYDENIVRAVPCDLPGDKK